MKDILAFNGEDEVFLTEPELEDLVRNKTKEFVELFQYTAVYLDVINELEKDLGSALCSINSSPMSVERKKRLDEGHYVLIELLVEHLGFEIAGIIIAETCNSINLAKIRSKNGKR